MTIPIKDFRLIQRLDSQTGTVVLGGQKYSPFSTDYIQALFGKYPFPVDKRKLPWTYKIDTTNRKVYADLGDHSVDLRFNTEAYESVVGTVVAYYREELGNKQLTIDHLAELSKTHPEIF